MNLDYLKEENQITFIPEGLAAEAGSLTFTIPDNPAHVSMKYVTTITITTSSDYM
jgi:hypothetical protein